MTASNAKPTPWPVSVYHMPAMSDVEEVQIFQIESANFTGRFDEGDANAALISEAFAVYHETGLTPSQLSDANVALRNEAINIAVQRQELEDQRVELLEALEFYMSQFGQALDANGIPYGNGQHDADNQARAAIARCKETTS